MFINFAAVITSLGRNAAFRIANAARPAADYLWSSILPERQMWNYNVESGNMTVRATMAGLVGMDSAYPPGGMVEISTFLENTAKIANEVPLTEAALRQMQHFLQVAGLAGEPTNERARDEVLNFLDKVIIQPHLDTAEWLRGQALTFGAINWTFNKKSLVVDYGIPVANKLATRTIAAGTNYAGANSMFWDDVRLIRRGARTAGGGLRVIVAHPDTIDEARYNTANNMVATLESPNSITFRKIIPDTNQFTPAAEDTVTVVLYDLEAEVLNPADTSTTLRIPFATRGKLVGIANNTASTFRVGQGSTENPNATNELGYTHVGPTVEGGGRPGRWSQLYTPEAMPWQLNGRAATNVLPVIEAPDKVIIATTEMTP